MSAVEDVQFAASQVAAKLRVGDSRIVGVEVIERLVAVDASARCACSWALSNHTLPEEQG